MKLRKFYHRGIFYYSSLNLPLKNSIFSFIITVEGNIEVKKEEAMIEKISSKFVMCEVGLKWVTILNPSLIDYQQ